MNSLPQDFVDKFSRALDSNMLVYDSDAISGQITAQTMEIFSELGSEDTDFGSLVKVTVPLEVVFEKPISCPDYPVVCFLTNMLNKWTKRRGIPRAAMAKVEKSPLLSNTPEFLALCSKLGVANTLDKKYFGILEYEHNSILCGI